MGMMDKYQISHVANAIKSQSPSKFTKQLHDKKIHPWIRTHFSIDGPYRFAVCSQVMDNLKIACECCCWILRLSTPDQMQARLTVWKGKYVYDRWFGWQYQHMSHGYCDLNHKSKKQTSQSKTLSVPNPKRRKNWKSE